MNNDQARGESSGTAGFHNWISLAGVVLAAGAFFSFLLLFAMDMRGGSSSPYLGILTFVVAPAFLICGLALMGLGWLWRWRLERRGHPEGSRLLAIDLNRPKDRRNLAIFAVGAAVFLLCSAVGSYRAFHFSESVAFCGQTCHTVMEPEHVTYTASSHAEVACTKCHVGPGPSGYIRAKLNGVHQLVATLRGNYERPVKVPPHPLPSEVTCQKCHRSDRQVGDLVRNYTHYLSDETNTVNTVRMILNVGGGDPAEGPVRGIHWHMSPGHRIEYIATDARQQAIPWVRLTAADGKVTEFRTTKYTNEPAAEMVRTMDCNDCHNRSAHSFPAPNDAVDQAMAAGRIDPALPFVRSHAIAALTQTNETVAEGLEKIAASLRAQYTNEARVASVIAQVQKIYTNSFFPRMKADWRAYPDHIGHKNWAGCFRCHDGRHQTADKTRKLGASGCNDCHKIIAQGQGAGLEKVEWGGMAFVHPEPSSEGADPDCFTCHTGGP